MQPATRAQFVTRSALQIVTIIFTLSLAFAGRKPTPPPPSSNMTLATGLNLVLGMGTQLDLYTESADTFNKTWSEQEFGGGSVIFADLEGDHKPEIVVARSCTIGKGRTAQAGYFLNVFHDGAKGVWQTTYDPPSQWQIETSPGVLIEKVPGATDAVVMRTRSQVSVFGLEGTVLRKLVTASLTELSQQVAGQTLGYGDVEVGDVDGDRLPEILMAATYRDASTGEDHSYLVALDPHNLALKFFVDLHDAVGSFLPLDVERADYDGDAIPEMWVSGYESHGPNAYDQKVFGLVLGDHVDLSAQRAVTVLERLNVEGNNEEYSLTLGPYLAVGDYLGGGDGKDEIIIQRRDPLSTDDFFPHRIEIFQFGNGAGFAAPVAVRYYTDRRVTKMVVEDGKLLVLGFIPYYGGGANGHFFELLGAPELPPSFQDIPLFSLQGSGEIGGLAAALVAP